MALKCEGQLGKLLHWPRDILPAASNHLNAWHQHSAVVAAVQASGKHVPSVVPERAEAEPALPDLLTMWRQGRRRQQNAMFGRLWTSVSGLDSPYWLQFPGPAAHVHGVASISSQEQAL